MMFNWHMAIITSPGYTTEYEQLKPDPEILKKLEAHGRFLQYNNPKFLEL